MSLSISLVLCRKNIATEKNKTDKLRIVNDSVAWTYKKGLLSHQEERGSYGVCKNGNFFKGNFTLHPPPTGVVFFRKLGFCQANFSFCRGFWGLDAYTEMENMTMWNTKE